ncbi:MAG: hypothetical protein J5I41_11990 [Saprospiraceae bacterium]|nr:hypothetical protein [Saprospiraceae bacterium]
MFRLTRIAPTPSGYIHPGNAASFLFTVMLARQYGASVLLRVDDLDRSRYRERYLEDLFRQLHWLEINWDEGPRNPAEFHAVWSQQHRRHLYRQTLERLVATGFVYACTCSRRQTRISAGSSVYSGTCREKSLPLDTPGAAWRIRVPDGTKVCFREGSKSASIRLDTVMGDFVIRQKDGQPSYQVASLTDDLYFGVDGIVRGEDLRPSTGAQCYLARIMDEPSFHQAFFCHHPLWKDERGRKLSKSEGAGSLRVWREEGNALSTLVEVAQKWLGSMQV